GRERDPSCRAGPRPPGRPSAAGGAGRRARVSRGTQRRAHPRRHRGKRHPRSVRGRDQLPLRAQPHARRGGRARARGHGRLRGRGRRPRARCASRPRRAARAGVRGRGRRRAAPQVRLDGRRAVLGARGARRQLRAGRCEPRAPRRGARAARADRGRRARSAGVAELSAARRAGDALRRGWTALPVSVRVLIVYVLARVVTTLFFAAADAASGPSSRFGVNPGIAGLATGWDGQWYWYTALNGYPSELPRTDDGLVAENPWAFMPVYAYL